MADMPNACVCVELNARNSFGGYTGLKKTEIMLNGNRLVDVLPATREMTYPCGPMTPLPELNGDYVAPPPPAAKKRALTGLLRRQTHAIRPGLPERFSQPLE